MSLAKTLIQKEIDKLKRGISVREIDNKKRGNSKTPKVYSRFIDTNKTFIVSANKRISELETDLKKL